MESQNEPDHAAAPTLEEPSSAATGTVDGAILSVCAERGVGVGAADPSTTLLLAHVALLEF